MSAGREHPPEHPPDDAARRRAWEDRTTTLLAVLGVGFVVAYSVFVLLPHAPDPIGTVLGVFLLIVWFVFFVDVVVRVALTPRGERLRWMFRHPVDVLSGVLPVFRAFRVVALVQRVEYFRRRSRDAIRAKFLTLAFSYAIVFIYFIALATLQVERDAPGANITTFGDSIWWAVVTLATVGYGDTYPITTLGRIYAVTLMIGGIAILGVASATVVSVLNERLAAVERNRHEHVDTLTTSTAAFEGRPSFDAASVLAVDDEDDPDSSDRSADADAGDARGGASG
ncbi:potassium channel family protein [Agromyces sp. MMS24-JH15]|uniref:potassium channel family protein n=1 Tax=Agromyces sp. MMS24-JH15 TaxID=3243765 RepID=UPI0037483D3A